MTKSVREELVPYGLAAAELQFRGQRFDAQQQRALPVFGICHIRDLRPLIERPPSSEVTFPEE